VSVLILPSLETLDKTLSSKNLKDALVKLRRAHNNRTVTSTLTVADSSDHV
jgi:hypothetical protein